jgi:hypothetical protein
MNLKKLLIIKFLFWTITMPLFSQTALITNVKQIKPSVRSEIVSTSSDFINLKNDVSSSTSALQTAISNLQAQSTNYVLRSGDTLNGNFTLNGMLGIGSTDSSSLGFVGIDQEDIMLINNTDDKMAKIKADSLGLARNSDGSYYFRADPSSLYYKSADTTNTRFYIDNNSGNIGIGNSSPQAKLDVSGSIKIADGTQGSGKVLTSDTNGLASWQTPPQSSIYPYISDYFHLGDTDAYGRKRLWFYDTNSVLKLGGANSDGDPVNADSEGIVVINNTNDKMARIKADRFGLTRASDSSYYFFRADPSSLYYKSADTTNTRFYIDNNSGNIGIGNSNPQAKLDVSGSIKIADGTQGSGKVLTSDANGLATWQTPTGGGNVGGSDGQIQYNHNGSLDGASSLYWDKNNSRLGLGLSNPTMPLHISGAGNNNTGIALTGTGSMSDNEIWLPTYYFQGTTEIGGIYWRGHNNGYPDFTLDTRGVQPALTINGQNGNVGIGNSVANPAEKLEVGGNIKLDGKIYTQDWTDLTPQSTYYAFSPLQYKVIGDQTCINGSITCLENNSAGGCYENILNYPLTKLPSNFSTNLPYQKYVMYIADPPTPPYEAGEYVLLTITNDGYIYHDGIPYNRYLNVNVCFRNKL